MALGELIWAKLDIHVYSGEIAMIADSLDQLKDKKTKKHGPSLQNLDNKNSDCNQLEQVTEFCTELMTVCTGMSEDILLPNLLKKTREVLNLHIRQMYSYLNN